MLRKTLAAVILVPLALAMVGVAVANRSAVSVSFDPFNPANPAYVLDVRLFVLMLVLIALGVVVGGVAAWLNQRKWRRAARRHQLEARQARDEAKALRERIEASEAHDARGAHDARRAGLPMALRPPAA